MTPRKPGRPPRSKKPALVRFELRLTEAEYKRWKTAAERIDLSLAVFVRSCVEVRIN